ncbi:MAG TPA: 4-hydroxy-3-methylbut-2-enyl diphosphate reductase [Ignavibacteriaceae bacterium]|nr:4-hydroxy-3-methylbut-2-enyl diphosphate reductase [Ignavibacteriaceae bacterium]
MKKFDIPLFYRSPIISRIKEIRKLQDPRKKDYAPAILDFGPLRIKLPRHFGFCYGVENAIEIAYKTIDENPNKRIFLLSEMIHNPEVNNDLLSRGIRFISDTYGNQLIDWKEISSDDIVIIPAFGTTIETEKILKEIGIDTVKYNTTCPFVEKVWNRAAQLGEGDHTIIIHGKASHEETRATFSHSVRNSHSLIVKDIEEAQLLGKIILGELPNEKFYELFANKYSDGFDVERDLSKIGVVNQTTMLATETQSIADYLKGIMVKKFGEPEIKNHFADTRDTLCYATNDNQQATIALLEDKSDFAIVVGGYNSSNTSHIVELCEEVLPTYFISNAEKIISEKIISHFDIHTKVEKETNNFIPVKNQVEIIVTSGASCPDAIVDEVMSKIISYFPGSKSVEEALNDYAANF